MNSNFKIEEDLITEFLAQEFSVRNQYSEMSLEEIGSDLEEKVSGLSDSEMHEYETCKALYCLILIDMDLNNHQDFPTEKLSRLCAHSEQTSELFESEGAQEQLRLVSYFERLGENPNIPIKQIQRQVAQAKCFAIEIEGATKLVDAINCFWGLRGERTEALLENLENFSINPDLHSYLEEMSRNFAAVSGNCPFPYGALTSLLRSLCAIKDPAKFRPLPLEVGILVFLFGQEMDLVSLQLKNGLGISGLTDQEITEMMFRLIRIQKAKSKILNIHLEIAPDDLSFLDEDFSRVSILLSKIHWNGNAPFKIAA